MPGGIPSNLKKADLAEDLGRLLIRSVCAIAPISRLDDFGIDTIATFLELDTNSHLRELATSTIGLQFKAKSVREIEFKKKHEANWLTELEFPYFIGSVDIKNASMELFSISMLKSLPDFSSLDSIILHLDENTKDDEHFRIELGDPILTIQISDISQSEMLVKIRNTLREWIRLEYINIRQRRLGKQIAMSWKTNEIPKINSSTKMYITGGENMLILEESKPYLDAALTELRLNSKEDWFDKEIESIVNKLATLGIFLETYDLMEFEDLKEKLGL